VHVGLQQTVCADDDVDCAGGKVVQDRALHAPVAEAGEHLHLDREWCQAAGERVEVLLGQDGGRHQHGDLLAVHHSLEGGPQRNLGLAVAHIAADQAIHRLLAFHISLDFGDGPELVFRLDIGEGSLQLMLPGRVRPEGVALDSGSHGVQLKQVAGKLLDGLAGGLFDSRPVGGA